MEQTAQLLTKDGKKVGVPLNAIGLSKLLTDLRENYADTLEWPLSEYEHATEENLKKVVEYLIHYSDPNNKIVEYTKPLPDSNFLRIASPEYDQATNPVKSFDYEFASSLTRDQAINVLLLADYMGMPGLENLLEAYIASTLYDLPPEEIRKILDINCDMTEEEKAKYEKLD